MSDKKQVIEIGTVVRLRSGGPKMTVTGLDEEDQFCHCVWFDRDEKHQTGTFPTAALYRPDS